MTRPAPITRPLRRFRGAGLALALLSSLALLAVPVRPQARDAADSLAGQFLVAAPGMPDLRFAETVIYMVRHDETGAMGLVINRPVGEIDLAELLEGFAAGKEPGGTAVPGSIVVHSGGPVQPQVGFVVHSDDVGLESSLAVTGHVAVTSDPKILRALASGRAPRRWLFVLGYAGWAPGQLEAELARHDWFVVPYDEELLFGADHGAKWQRALELRGIEL